ncbi:MAG TPA: hypothetical protein VFH24_00905, partial [Gemmatimonadales bacterium]|nr:hypothetical protein [Gemmatimonadales bacterium]
MTAAVAAAGNITDLGSLTGNYAFATDINDAGLIVGYSQISTGALHAFYWDNGRMTDMGTLGGAESQAFGVEETGRIVGETNLTRECAGGDPATGISAFLWQAGTMTALPRLSGSCRAGALALNGNGRIVGFSWEDRNNDGST